MNTNKSRWDKKHDESTEVHRTKSPSDFAKDVNKLILPGSKILELGCGAGVDAVFFASSGHEVIATDFSEVAIKRNQKFYPELDNLKFEVMDISKPFNFLNQEFGVVFAMLSLHYFTDEETKKIFAQIHRVLETKGLLAFVCKSTKDPQYGMGKEIEKDVFEKDNGYTRHFFSEDYAKECLGDKFKLISLESGEETFFEQKSAFIRVIVEKI